MTEPSTRAKQDETCCKQYVECEHDAGTYPLPCDASTEFPPVVFRSELEDAEKLLDECEGLLQKWRTGWLSHNGVLQDTDYLLARLVARRQGGK